MIHVSAGKITNRKKSRKRVGLFTPDESSDDDTETAVKALAEVLESDSDDNIVDECADDKVALSRYVVVRYSSKRSVAHFVGQITNIVDVGLAVKVNFLKRCGNSFVWPELRDEDVVPEEDIKAVLPDPITIGGTARVCLKLQFQADLAHVK